MAKNKCGIIGMGYISGYHIDAIRRAGIDEKAVRENTTDPNLAQEFVEKQVLIF